VCVTEYTVTQGTDIKFVITLTTSDGVRPFSFDLTFDIGNNFKSLSGANDEELRLDDGNNLSLGNYVCECSVANSDKYTTPETFSVTVVS